MKTTNLQLFTAQLKNYGIWIQLQQ